MRVLILGSGGMLGHKLAQVFSQDHQVWGTASGDASLVAHFTGIPQGQIFHHFDALSDQDLERTFEVSRPDLVINAIGLVKQSEKIENEQYTWDLNVNLPQRIEAQVIEAESRMIHLSTDCVFTGEKGNYKETDIPDSPDLYGRSKIAGERSLKNALVIRTSAIGHELGQAHGLFEWLMSQPPGAVPGYSEAFWSGFPSITFAKLVAQVVERAPDLSGIYHLSSHRVNKFELLSWVTDKFGGPWEMVPLSEPKLDRSLDGDRLIEAAQLKISDWPDLIEELYTDSQHHNKLKAALQ